MDAVALLQKIYDKVSTVVESIRSLIYESRISITKDRFPVNSISAGNLAAAAANMVRVYRNNTRDDVLAMVIATANQVGEPNFVGAVYVGVDSGPSPLIPNAAIMVTRTEKRYFLIRPFECLYLYIGAVAASQKLWWYVTPLADIGPFSLMLDDMRG